MPTRYHRIFSSAAMVAAMTTLPALCNAATIELDGVKITTLSQAVAAAQDADDGPHIINITTDKLPTADGQVIITEPMTINGDADGNGTKCDILADVKSIQALPVDKAEREKGYLEVQCAGAVTISDLQIHPNADAATVEAEFVDAIRLLAPPRKRDHGTYVLNRVWASGSDGNNKDAFVPLTSTEDLYNKPGIKKWSGQDQRLARAVIQVDKEKPLRKALKQMGTYDCTLTDCQAGLGRGPALNIAPNSGTHIVNGGIFGHSGTEGIRIAGETVTVKGTPQKRVVVLRTGNETTAESSGAVAALFDAHIGTMEYVDVAVDGGKVPYAIAGTAVVERRAETRTISDVAGIFSASPKVLDAAPAAVSWVAPVDAWQEAQATKKPMLLFFYSPGVVPATELNKLFESHANAKKLLGKFACSRVDITQPIGDSIAKKYQIFKVPTLLLIAHDAKSYKKITPTPKEPWEKIELQLTAN